MKKFDLEACLYIHTLKLKVVEENKYLCKVINNSDVYVFNSYDDYKSFFLENDVNINDELLRTCKMKETKKGTIIALKKLCDYTITNLLYIKLQSKDIDDEIVKKCFNNTLEQSSIEECEYSLNGFAEYSICLEKNECWYVYETNDIDTFNRKTFCDLIEALRYMIEILSYTISEENEIEKYFAINLNKIKNDKILIK